MSTTVAARGTNLGGREATTVVVTKAVAAEVIPTGIAVTGGQLGGMIVGEAGKNMMETVGGVIRVLEVMAVGGIGVHPLKRDPEDRSGKCFQLMHTTNPSRVSQN